MSSSATPAAPTCRPTTPRTTRASATCSYATRPAAATPRRATRRRPARSASASRPRGPGATNIVTPLTDAMMDSVPIVVFTGQVRTDLLGTDGFQEADTFGITMPIVKHSFMIQHPTEIPRAIHEAFHLARTGRPGPVLIDMPRRSHARGDRLRAGRRRPPARLPADHRGQLEADPPRGQGDRQRPPAGHLRRRRRHQRRRVRGAAGVRHRDRAPRHLHADGPRRVPGAARAVARACSACTARAPPTTRWTRPT